MAYRKVHAGLRGALHSQDLESDELQAAVELEWDMEKELEEPGMDRFQLEDGEQHSVGNSSRVADLDLEPIQPSTSPHGRFERLQEDPDYVSHFTRPPPKSPLRPGCSLTCYVLLGAALFILGLLIGRFAHRPAAPTPAPPPDTDLFQKILQDISAEKIRATVRDLNALSLEDGGFSQAKFLLHRWTELGLTDVQLTNYSVLLSQAGSTPSTITDRASGKCFLPNRKPCDGRNRSPASEDQLSSFAAYSAVGNLEAEVVDVQYGTVKDLIRADTTTSATKRIALLKLGQAPLLYTLSLLTEAGFLGVLPYVDPCDLPDRPGLWDQSFGISLNPGGDPSTPGYPSIAGSFRLHRANLTSLLVQPISASLAQELLSAPTRQGGSCVPLATAQTAERKTIVLSIGTQAAYRTVYNVIGYLKGATNPDRYVLVGGRHDGWHSATVSEWSGGIAVMTQIIASLTARARQGWQPDRTTAFCSWGGSAFGQIGSFEWGEENGVVLQSKAVAYVSLHRPVRGRGPLRPTASPSLLQLASDIHKKLSLNCTQGGGGGGGGACSGANVSSVQPPGDVRFFADRLAVPTLEFALAEATAGEKTSFLSEAFLPANSSAVESLDPTFKLHEIVAKMTAEAVLRLSTDPVLPFLPLDIALDVQNKLRGDRRGLGELVAQAAALRESATFLQSEVMRPANDPKERDPPHLRMLNDVLRDLEKSFIAPDAPPGLYRNLLYCLNEDAADFSILRDVREDRLNASLSRVLTAISGARGLVGSGLDLFENDPGRTN